MPIDSEYMLTTYDMIVNVMEILDFDDWEYDGNNPDNPNQPTIIINGFISNGDPIKIYMYFNTQGQLIKVEDR